MIACLEVRVQAACFRDCTGASDQVHLTVDFPRDMGGWVESEDDRENEECITLGPSASIASAAQILEASAPLLKVRERPGTFPRQLRTSAEQGLGAGRRRGEACLLRVHHVHDDATLEHLRVADLRAEGRNQPHAPATTVHALSMASSLHRGHQVKNGTQHHSPRLGDGGFSASLLEHPLGRGCRRYRHGHNQGRDRWKSWGLK